MGSFSSQEYTSLRISSNIQIISPFLWSRVVLLPFKYGKGQRSFCDSCLIYCGIYCCNYETLYILEFLLKPVIAFVYSVALAFTSFFAFSPALGNLFDKMSSLKMTCVILPLDQHA